MRLRLLALLCLAALLPCGALMAEDEERLPGWLGEVSREGSGGTGGLLRGGAAKATTGAASKKKRSRDADAARARGARLPADGIPEPGTVHPEARGAAAQGVSPSAPRSDTLPARRARSRRRLSS